MNKCTETDCERQTPTEAAKYCEQCCRQHRRKPAKYPWDTAKDAILVTAYGARNVKALAVAVKRLGYPRWICKRRAQHLGIAQTRKKEPPWTARETAIVEKWGWQGPERIRKRMTDAGFSRTLTAIVVKRKRMHCTKTGADGYTATGLAALLGIDPTTVARWVRTNLLEARHRETLRTPQQGGDEWWIHRDALYRFILHNPTLIDLRKVSDQLWFLDVVTQGKIGVEADFVGVPGHGDIGGHVLPS